MRRWEEKRKEYCEHRGWKVEDRYWMKEVGKLLIGVVEKKKTWKHVWGECTNLGAEKGWQEEALKVLEEKGGLDE